MKDSFQFHLSRFRLLVFLSFFLISVFSLLISTPAAHAACARPAGSAGNLMYNKDYHVPQYCDGTLWWQMGNQGAGGTGCAQLNGGPVGWWKFDDASSGTTPATAADSSGNGNTGTNVGSPTWVAGHIGVGALSFNGTSQYVTVASTSLVGTGAATISAWVYPTAVPASAYDIFTQGDMAIECAMKYDGSFYCSNDSFSHSASTNTALTLNQWNFVTAVRNSDQTFTMYLNGVQTGDANHYAGIPTASINNAVIGADWGGGAYWFPGRLDDLRVYSRALSAAEITALYNTGTVTDPEGTVAYNAAYHVLQYCDGANWKQIGATGAGQAIATATNSSYVISDPAGSVNVLGNSSASTSPFIVDGANAIDALGQFASTSSDATVVYTTKGVNNNNGATISALGLGATNAAPPPATFGPDAVALDATNHRLFVADTGNLRVLVYGLGDDNSIPAASGGHTASYVLGQAGFTTKTAGTSATTLLGADDLAYDAVNNRLFVEDDNGSIGTRARVLVFNLGGGITNGMAASYVLGEPDMVTANISDPTQAYIGHIYGLAYDAVNSRLFVADDDNRVLVFNVAPGTIANGENASYVLGQTLYTTNAAPSPPTQSSLWTPAGLAYDATNSRLFVADSGNSRVLVFNVAPDVTSGLVGWWMLDDGSGTTAADSSGSGYTGTLSGTTLPTWTTGKINGALSFNGTTAYVNTGDNHPLGAGAATVSAWVYLNSYNASGFSQIFSQGNGGLDCNVLTSGSQFACSHNGFTNTAHAATNSAVLGQWQFFTVVRDSSGNLTLYVNGVQSGTAAQSAGTAGAGTIGSAIGTRYDAVNYFWPGIIDDVRFYNRALSAAEVAYIYNYGSIIANDKAASNVLGQTLYNTATAATSQSGMYTPTGVAYDAVNNRLFVADGQNTRVTVFNVAPDVTSGLVGWWMLDEGSGTTAADSSGNGNTGTSQNSPTWTTSGKINGALLGDATLDQEIDVPSSASLNFTGNFTVSSWIKTTALNNTNQSTLFDKGSWPTVGFQLDDNGPWSPNIFFRVLPGGNSGICGTGMACFSRTVVNDGAWHMITGVFDGSTVNLYSDGVLKDSQSSGTFTADTTDGVYFGNFTGPSGNGTIDDVRLYNRALSATEVAQIYNYGGSIITNGENASYVLGQPDFTTIADATTRSGLWTDNGGYFYPPAHLGYDPNSGHLFVPDTGNSRVMVFPTTANTLALWWKLDDASSGSSPATALDSSGNGNTGTLEGTALPVWTGSGKIGNALTFDGVDDWVNTDFSGAPVFDQAPFTVSAWLKFNALPASGMALVTGDLSAAPWAVWNLYSSPDNYIHFEVLDSGGTDHEVATPSAIVSVGPWYHVAATLDSSYNLKLYINGVQQTATANSGSMYNAATWLAISGSASGSPFNGTIDDVRFYNYALSAAEISTLYNYTAAGTLVGWWKFDEGTGTLAYDSSGGGNTGTTVNAPTWGAGKIGNALTFNGTSQYVSVADAASLELAGSSTVSAWVKLSALPASGAFGVIISKDDILNYTNYSIFVDNNTTNFGSTGLGWGLNFQDVNGSDIYAKYVTSISTGVWYHVAGVYDSVAQTETLYLNGASVATTSTVGYTPVSDGGKPLTIGSENAGTYLAGTIDDARIYSYALSATQIANLYQAGNGIPGGLVGWWKLDETSGTSAADSSGSGNTGTLHGTVLPVWTSTGKINGTLAFDGNTDYVGVSGPVISNTSTVTAWVYQMGRSAGSNQGLITYDSDHGIMLNNGTLIFRLAGSNYPANTQVPINSWHHLAVVNNAGAVTFYYDGNPDGTTTSIPAFTAAEIGNDVGGEPFYGYIDDARVYNRALSAAEVAALYGGSSCGPAAPSSNLAGWWKFDETSGTSAADSSGNGNTGTVTPNATGFWVAGKVNNAANLNGSTQYVTVANPSNFNFDRTNPFSISAWVYRASYDGTDDVIAGKMDIATGMKGYSLILPGGTFCNGGGSNGCVIFTMSSDAGGGNSMRAWTVTTLVTGTWQHVVVTYNGNSNISGIHIYINGVDQSLTSDINALTASTTHADPLLVGAIPGSGYFNGTLDDVRVYNVALTATQIAALYNSASPTHHGEGDLMYNSTYNVMQYCNGTNFVRIGKHGP